MASVLYSQQVMASVLYSQQVMASVSYSQQVMASVLYSQQVHRHRKYPGAGWFTHLEPEMVATLGTDYQDTLRGKLHGADSQHHIAHDSLLHSH